MKFITILLMMMASFTLAAALPTLSFVTDSQIVNQDESKVLVVVTLSAPSNGVVSVPYTMSGTATSSDHNLPEHGTIYVTPKQTKGFLTFNLKKQAPLLEDKTVQIELGAPMNAQLGKLSSHEVVITSEKLDLPIVTLAKKEQNVAIGASFTVKLILSRAHENTVIVPVKVSGSAVSMVDHNLQSGAAVFPVGETAIYYQVKTFKSATMTTSKTIVIQLGAPANNAKVGKTSKETITIAAPIVDDPNNHAPQIAATRSLMVLTNQTLSFTMNTATDEDGDSLTYKIKTPVSHGTLSGCVGNDNVITPSISCSYLPTTDFVGDDSFVVEVSDGKSAVSQVVTISVVVSFPWDYNQPVFNPYPTNTNFTINQGEYVEFTIPEATVKSGMPVTYSLSIPEVEFDLTGCGSNQQSTETQVDRTKVCRLTPKLGFAGATQYRVTAYTVVASENYYGTITVRGTNIGSHPPTFVDSSLKNVYISNKDVFYFTIPQATDLDGDPIHYYINFDRRKMTLGEECLVEGVLPTSSPVECSFTFSSSYSGYLNLDFFMDDGKYSVYHPGYYLQVTGDGPGQHAPIIPNDPIIFDNIGPGIYTFMLPTATDGDGDPLTYRLNDPMGFRLDGCRKGDGYYYDPTKLCTLYVSTGFESGISNLGLTVTDNKFTTTFYNFHFPNN